MRYLGGAKCRMVRNMIDKNVHTDAKQDHGPRIYVACLAAYNHGCLYGDWFALKDYDDVEELSAAIQEMLKDSVIPNAEEFAIHEYEGFYGYQIHEYENLETVLTLGYNIAEHGEAYVLFCKNYGSIADVEDFQEAYVGEYDSEIDYAQEIFDEQHITVIPEAIRNYFDYALYAQDLFINDYFAMKNETNRVYVYRAI